MTSNQDKPLVSILMGSKSDWSGVMEFTASTLRDLGVPYDVRVISAHRTPDQLIAYVDGAEERGIEVFIAAAGGAAHLPGVTAGLTTLPVLGVPMKGWALGGLDALLAIVQMPKGVPVGTTAIGKAGAVNAALLAVSILGKVYPEHAASYKAFRKKQSETVVPMDFLND